jgi:hypothetical protein
MKNKGPSIRDVMLEAIRRNMPVPGGLTVLGDIGEAVYEWGQDISLEFLASLDFGYFHGKCQASESGRDFDIWDVDKAIVQLRGDDEKNVDTKTTTP